jgi:hypothetical protein
MKVFAKRGTCVAYNHHFEVPICGLTRSSADTDISSDTGNHDVFYASIPQPPFKIGRGESTRRQFIKHDFARPRL